VTKQETTDDLDALLAALPTEIVERLRGFANRADLLGSALTVPVYWVMMSVAAVKAFVQLFQAPTFWEKTVHGLVRK